MDAFLHAFATEESLEHSELQAIGQCIFAHALQQLMPSKHPPSLPVLHGKSNKDRSAILATAHVTLLLTT